VWQERARRATPRILAVISAVILTAVAFYSAAIVFVPQTPGMAVRIWVLLAFMVVAAVSTWMLVVGQQSLGVKLAVNLAGGFNLIWMFSFFGPPVVVASVIAAGLASVPAPRRLLPVLIGVAVAGLCLGLLTLQIR
jgi:hypothetical protein